MKGIEKPNKWCSRHCLLSLSLGLNCFLMDVISDTGRLWGRGECGGWQDLHHHSIAMWWLW